MVWGPRAPPTVKVSRIQHGQHDAFVVRSCHLYCGLVALPLGPAASPSSPFLYCGSSYLQFCITITFKGKDHFPAAAIEECPDWGGSAVRGGMSSPTIRRGFSARARSPLSSLTYFSASDFSLARPALNQCRSILPRPRQSVLWASPGHGAQPHSYSTPFVAAS